MSQDAWNKEWQTNKWLIRGTAVLANGLLSILVFIAVGIVNDIKEVKASVATIVTSQAKVEVRQEVNTGQILGLKSELGELQKDYYSNK